jgi:hypothetical protein
VIARPLGAQSAATVSAEEPVYRALDELAALVPLPGFIVGQRPYSRREVARLLRAAERSQRSAGAPRDAAAVRARALTALVRASLGADAPSSPSVAATDSASPTGGPIDAGSADRASRGRWAVRPVAWAAVHALGSGSPPRPVPRDNGIGTIDARSNPPLDARFGRPTPRGGALSFESSHELGIGGWLALVAQPRLSLVATDGGGAVRPNVEPQRLAARAVWRNLAVQGGIDGRVWGQAGGRSLFLSANARPLRAVSVGSDTAFTLPWLLRRAGRVRGELLVADLGATQHFPHAKLAAYRLDAAPTAWLELGAGLMSHMGGRGAPPLTFAQRAKDLFPYVFWLVDEGSDALATNKLANAQLRVRIPGWRSATVYWEGSMDDFDLRRVRSMLWDDTGHLVGLTLPRLADDGSLALDVQLHHTSLRLYQHYQFLSGLTYRGQILGNPLGPNAQAAYVALTWRPEVRTTVELAVAAESRDSSVWTSRVQTVDEDGFTFVRVRPGVVEERGRASVLVRRDAIGAGRGWFARAGVERVTDAGFVRRPAAVQGFAEAGAVVRF